MGNSNSYIDSDEVANPPIDMSFNTKHTNIFADLYDFYRELIRFESYKINTVDTFYNIITNAPIEIKINGNATPVDGIGPIQYPRKLKQITIYNISRALADSIVIEASRRFSESIKQINPTSDKDIVRFFNVFLNIPDTISLKEITDSINQSIKYAFDTLISDTDELIRCQNVEKIPFVYDIKFLTFESVDFRFENHIPKNIWKLLSSNVMNIQLSKLAADTMYHFSTVEWPRSKHHMCRYYGTLLIDDGVNNNVRSNKNIITFLIFVGIVLLIVGIIIPHVGYTMRKYDKSALAVEYYD